MSETGVVSGIRIKSSARSDGTHCMNEQQAVPVPMMTGMKSKTLSAMVVLARDTDKIAVKFFAALLQRMTMTMTMTHSEKSLIYQMKAWPYRQECRGHGPTKKNLSYR